MTLGELVSSLGDVTVSRVLLATAGYAGMAEHYQSPEQEYIRRLTDKNIPLNK